MPNDQLALLFALVIAAMMLVLIALQLPRFGRRFGRVPSAADGYTRTTNGAISWHNGEHGPAAAGTLLSGSTGLPPPLYQRMTRLVSLLFIVSAMAIIALTGMPNATPLIVLLLFGLILIELFQDVLPASSLGRWRLPAEATIVLVFLTILVAMTGGHASPFFFGYVLLVGAAALSTSALGAAVLAVACSIAYILAVLVASGSAPLATADFGMVAFNLVAISLFMYVASVIGREQRRAREEALRLSRFDSLTGLFSRDFFMSSIEQEVLRATRSGRPFAVAMLDLDGLKAANDRFGHDWGDNLLKAVADVLHGDIRVTDVAARYGGDEFTLLLPETDLSGAVLVAEKVRVDISRLALPHNGAVVRTSASIGIVTFPEDGRSSAELMRRADLAMYEAKRRGRDQIVRFAREAPPATAAPPTSTSPPPGTSVGQAQSQFANNRAGHRYPLNSAGVAVGPGERRGLAPEEVHALAPPMAAPPGTYAPSPPDTHNQPTEPAARTAAGSVVSEDPRVDVIPPESPGPAPWETR